MVKVHNRDRQERGQTLIFFVLAMPVFLAIVALVVDGSMLLVKRRALQNAADAAALAAAQDWPLGGPCVGACLASLQTSANNYSDKNGGPALHPCSDPDPTNPTDTNCFAAPYVDKTVYTSWNAMAISAYLEASWTRGRPELKTRALKALDFLWERLHTDADGMFRYLSPNGPQVPGLLNDQAWTALACLDAQIEVVEDLPPAVMMERDMHELDTGAEPHQWRGLRMIAQVMLDQQGFERLGEARHMLDHIHQSDGQVPRRMQDG